MIAFHIWPIAVHWYGIFYAVSFLLWFFYLRKIILAWKWLKVENLDKFMDDLLFFAILWVLLWWRLGYVFFYNPEYFVHQPWKIFYIWEWWMAFAWAFIWVWLSLYFLSRKYKINLLNITDLIVSFLPFWLGLGRIWNYLNWELYWKYCPSFLVWTFMCSYFWTEQLHLANQLLESFFEWWLLFIIMQILVWKFDLLKKRWVLTLVFIFYYSVVRFSLEFIRRHPSNYILYFWLSISQFFMILFFILWIILFFYLRKVSKK